MAQQYGTVKVDVITYTSGTGGSETDQSITVSSLATISRTGIIVTGNIQAENITVNSGLSVGGLADVSGLVVGHDATITGNLIVGSGISASSLIVQNDATVSGNLGVSGLATVSGLTVTGNATVSGNLEVSGNATVTGDVTVSGGLEVSGNAEVEGNLQVSGNTTVTGNVSVSGDLNVDGDINASGVTISGFTGLFEDGSESNPSISFASDPDTGIYKNAGNHLSIATSGVRRVTVRENGDLGVGTAGFDNLGSVSHPALGVYTPSGSRIGYWGSDGRWWYVHGETGSSTTIGCRISGNTIDSDKVFILSDGNVGINEGSPARKLVVTDSNNILRLKSTSIASRIEFENSGTSSFDSVAVGSQQNDMQFVTSGSEQMRLTQSGDLGINVTGPQARIHLYGSGDVLGTVAAAVIDNATPKDCYIKVSENSSDPGAGGGVLFSSLQADARDSAGMAAIKGILVNGTQNTVGDIAFCVRNDVSDTTMGEVARFTNAGTMGLNMSNPQADIHVKRQNSNAAGTVRLGRDYYSYIEQSVNNLNIVANGDTDYRQQSGVATNNGSGNIKFFTAQTTGTNTQRAIINSYGRMGINEGNPSAMLELYGNGTESYDALIIAGAEQGIASKEAKIRLVGTNSTSGSSQVSELVSYQPPVLGGGTRAALGFNVRNNGNSFSDIDRVMTIFGNGRVGIGVLDGPQLASVLNISGGARSIACTQPISASGTATIDGKEFFQIATTEPGDNFSFTASDRRLMAGTVTNDNSIVWRAANPGFLALSDIKLYTSGNSTAPKVVIRSNGRMGIGTTTPATTLDVQGSLSKLSGSFRIPHPLPSLAGTHDLVHSFVEAPDASNLYAGMITLTGGKAEVNIDTAHRMTEGTFEALNILQSHSTSNEGGYAPVKSSMSGNVLHIYCQDPTSNDKVYYEVRGIRKDKHMFDTEWTDENGRVITEPLRPVAETEEEINEQLKDVYKETEENYACFCKEQEEKERAETNTTDATYNAIEQQRIDEEVKLKEEEEYEKCCREKELIPETKSEEDYSGEMDATENPWPKVDALCPESTETEDDY